MPILSQQPLQAAIYQQLTADSALMALITGVYDMPPQGSAFPYVTIGDALGADWGSKTTNGMEYILQVFVWSREGGRKQAANIMEKVHSLLHFASFSVTGHTLVMIRCMATALALEDDGCTFRGMLRFRVLLEAA